MIEWGSVDPRLLDPEFHRDVEEFLGQSPFTWRVTEGYRSQKRSAELYEAYKAGGPRAAPAGKSAHNWGLAVDIVLMGEDGRPSWNTRLAGWVWLVAKARLHPRLHDGQDFGDTDHLERYQWTRHIKRPTPGAT